MLENLKSQESMKEKDKELALLHRLLVRGGNDELEQ